MHKIRATQIFHSQYSENEIDDRSRRLDVRMIDHALWLKTRERKHVDIFFERYAVLQSETDRDCKTVESRLRKVAPSLCMSTKISPRLPSAYSPVRKYTLCPATLASTVNPPRFLGILRRSVIGGPRTGARIAAEDATGAAATAAATGASSFFLSFYQTKKEADSSCNHRDKAQQPGCRVSMIAYRFLQYLQPYIR